jgi:hypothetical protein
VKSLHLGIIDHDASAPERFFCASESAAVVPIPSLTTSEAFDSGVLFEAGVAERLIDHARQCYAGSRKVETAHALHAHAKLHTTPGPQRRPARDGRCPWTTR